MNLTVIIGDEQETHVLETGAFPSRREVGGQLHWILPLDEATVSIPVSEVEKLMDVMFAWGVLDNGRALVMVLWKRGA